jgi:hypothetical protein
MSTEGEKLIARCKQHILAAMQGLPERAPNWAGLRSKEIEREAGLALNLPGQDGWLTWSILLSLVSGGEVQVLQGGKPGMRHFRLSLST